MSDYTPPPPPPVEGGGGPGGGELIYPAQPPKDPILILVLNLLLAGCVGYFILGQKMKGIVTLVVWILGLASCGIVSGLVAVATAIDGYLQAQHLQAGHPVGPWTFYKNHM
ncbi:MAG TPA: hypothetical protein VJ032_10700 [Thermoanaerobaculia bacterium]|nr:hypothetical protein [Thermoanaerobaculia bacterium]